MGINKPIAKDEEMMEKVSSEAQAAINKRHYSKINQLLNRGPLELIPGVKREQGKDLLAQMGKKSWLPS